jgi:hypothetical protein
MKRTPAVLIAVVTLVAGGTVAATASSADDATYAGCVNKSSGALRVIQPSGSCTSKEYKITWNEKGPRGARGPRGFKGENGKDGMDGKDGKDGSANIVDGVRTDENESVAAGERRGIQSNCPAGTIPIGRNFEATDVVSIFTDESASDRNGDQFWQMSIYNGTSGTVGLYMQAICIGAPAATG